MNRQSLQPTKVMKTSSTMTTDDSLASMPSPLKTISKRAQRRNSDQLEALTTAIAPLIQDIKNGGNKANKGRRRGHKATSSMEMDDDIDYRSEPERLADEQDIAIERINTAVAGYASRVAEINKQSKSRPVSSHIDADDAYGQRKAAGAANYHKNATLGVDGHLKSQHLVREVANTLNRGVRRMKRDERHGGQAAVNDRLNQLADKLSYTHVQHDAAHTVYAEGHHACHTDKQTRTKIHQAPHRARRAATRGVLAHGDVHGVESLGHNGIDESLRLHHTDIDLSA